jgi:hypothetical protein
MVLSGSKKTSSMASIMNQDTKGGNKKAGFPASIGRSTAMTVALRQTSQNSTVLKSPEASSVCSSRPVGSLPGNWRKC